MAATLDIQLINADGSIVVPQRGDGLVISFDGSFYTYAFDDEKKVWKPDKAGVPADFPRANDSVILVSGLGQQWEFFTRRTLDPRSQRFRAEAYKTVTRPSTSDASTDGAEDEAYEDRGHKEDEGVNNYPSFSGGGVVEMATQDPDDLAVAFEDTFDDAADE